MLDFSNIKSVLIDTSFLIRLLNEKDALHRNAIDFMEHFLGKNVTVFLSSIVIAEYCVKDDFKNIPLDSFRLIAFDHFDAECAGKLRALLLSKREPSIEGERNVVINDIKLLAQIFNRNIDAFITKDIKFIQKIYEPIRQERNQEIKIINLELPLKECLGTLF